MAGRWLGEHVVRPARHLFDWYKKYEKNPFVRMLKWAATGALALVMASFVKPHLAEWYIRHSRDQHALGVYTLYYRTDKPHCSVYTISLATAEKIDSLHISLWFDPEIHQIVRLRGYKRVGNNVTIDVSASTPKTVKAPCELSVTSTEPDQALTFTPSADRHQIIIDGRDVTLADTQTLLVVLYPDDTEVNKGNIGWSADGTYEQFGYRVPLRYSFSTYEQGTGKSMHLFDTDEHLLKLH
jgi:hypothetical protein